jgi:hypothetical protein
VVCVFISKIDMLDVKDAVCLCVCKYCSSFGSDMAAERQVSGADMA